MANLTENECKKAFKALSKALSQSKVPSEAGPHRWAKAEEFMLMQVHGDEWGFKHRDTRNYLFVTCHGTLRVPMTDEPFLRGYF